MAQEESRAPEHEWVGFPGGELEGRRPAALCPSCRAERQRLAASPVRVARHQRRPPPSGSRLLCFQCYRADMERTRALRAAGSLNTASAARFQAQLPFETVDRPRLEMLKAERSESRVLRQNASFSDRRRRAQIAARRALQAAISPSGAGLASRLPERARAIAAAIHAAELQLPESWIPFVVSG